MSHPRNPLAAILGVLFLLSVQPLAATAQASSFTYQGQLRQSGEPFTGMADLEFRLFDQLSGGNAIGSAQSLPNWPVEDGLFQVELNFGAAAFDGNERFLEVTVDGAPLVPRQKITAAPYALLATGLASGSVGGGSIDPSQVQLRVDGSCPSGQAIRIVNESGSVVCEASGGAASGWSLTGNAGTDPSTDFIGTTDDTPLELRTANVRGLRIEPSSLLFEDLPLTANVIAGSRDNIVAEGVRGATISGGGTAGNAEFSADPDNVDAYSNRVYDHYGTVGGGASNRVGNFFASSPANDDMFATIGGGLNNEARSYVSTIGGGFQNIADAEWSTIGGGDSNRANGLGSAISGGLFNRASSDHSTVGGGYRNTASGEGSTVGGGSENCAGGAFSWAGGVRAKVRPGFDSGALGSGCNSVELSGDANGDNGTFVWADSQVPFFTSTGANQFLVRAEGGMAVNTNTPRAPLTVESEGKWNPDVGNGFGDFHVGNSTLGLAIGLATGGGGAGAVRLWPTGGNEQITFTTATLHPTQILTLNNSGRVGIRRDASTNALEVSGNASKSTSGSWLANSDGRIKTEVNEIENALDRLMRVRPVTFRYTADYLEAHPDIADEIYFNVIAQEFADVFPDAVQGSGDTLPGQEKSEENEILQVDVHPALMTSIAAVQELAVRLEHSEAKSQRLERKNQALAERLAKLEARHGARIQVLQEQQDADLEAMRHELAILRELVAPRVAQEVR